MAIEIVEHTLLRLFVRRGTNADRQNVILGDGEPGYTLDTKKLYLGDGTTPGGNQVTGSRFLGSAGDITTLSPGDRYDMAFSTSTNSLYYLNTNDGSTLSDWVAMAGLYNEADGTITITGSNGLKLGDCAGAGLTKDSSNKLEIAASIATDAITPKLNTYLALPASVAFGQQLYNWPTNGNVNTFLRYNAGGVLTWEAIGGTSTTFVNADIYPVGTIVPFADTTLPANGRFLRCDGSYAASTSYQVLSAVLGTSYGPLSTNPNSGIIHFKLPDLRGKSPLGYSTTNVTDLSGNNYTFAFASSGGLYRQMLSAGHIPAHSHYTVADVVQTDEDFTASRGFLARRWNDPGTGTGEYRLAGTTTVPTIAPTSQAGTLSSLQLPITLLSPYLALNYIIKALPDPVAECQITIADSLSASLNGSNVFNINPLSGNYNIGLNTIHAGKDAGFAVFNNKGLATSFDSSSAGQTAIMQPNSVELAHSFGYINFLRDPISIASGTLFGTIPNDWSNKINVWPLVTSVGGTVVPNKELPTTAKNVVLDVMFRSALGTSGYLYSSMNGSLSAATETPGTKEYLVAANNGYMTGSQVTVPLSANLNNGQISFVLRGYNTAGSTLDVRIVGWTL